MQETMAPWAVNQTREVYFILPSDDPRFLHYVLTYFQSFRRSGSERDLPKEELERVTLEGQLKDEQWGEEFIHQKTRTRADSQCPWVVSVTKGSSKIPDDLIKRLDSLPQYVGDILFTSGIPKE
ncbi:hypothetical protein HYU13_02010 [Candidatus Woesearchaeota archaeon]|nr:hypothetical protein [Candidatus Woesearchaeota archaeon]